MVNWFNVSQHATKISHLSSGQNKEITNKLSGYLDYQSPTIQDISDDHEQFPYQAKLEQIQFQGNTFLPIPVNDEIR